MANSINTNIAAYFAQANLTRASDDASSSVARLSSGNRIVRASDDVAALATGTSLLSTVSALRAAQNNAAQGTSLLQVADGALAQVQNILQQQKSIALQAGSGTLTNTDRGFLNQQFQALTLQINSLSDSTTFNGVQLINGSLSNSALVDDVVNQSKTASASINLAVNPTVSGDTLTIAGVQLTATTNASPGLLEFKIGATAADTIANLASKLNTLAASTTYATSLGQATYSAVGSQLQITARTGGSLGENFRIDTSTGASTLISGSKASIGGAFGGSTVKFFSNAGTSLGFTSATTSVTAATASATSPFQAGDSITARVGSNPEQTLYTLTAGDSLTTIVNGINVRSATTGISASLTFDSTSRLYNIELRSNNSTSAISIKGGANYYNVADRTHALNGATRTQSLFTAEYAQNNIVAGATVVGTSLAAPFVNGNTLTVAYGSNSATTLATIATGDTLASLVTKINNGAGAKSLGLFAALSTDGKNINFTYADATGTTNLLIDGGDGFFNTDATGIRTTNGLNNTVSSIRLFNTGFAATSTTVAAGTSTTTSPFQNGDAITVTIPGVNGGSAISLGTVGAAATLAGLVASINTSAGALANGIKAQIVQDSSGLFNIALNVATNSAATSITFDGGTNYFAGATVYSLTSPTSVSFGNPVNEKNLFTSTFANTLTAGQTVTTLAAAGNATAARPFKSGNFLSVYTANNQATTGLQISATLTDTDLTLANIVTSINTYAAANNTGVTAALTADGRNISLFSATKIISFNAGPDFYSAGGADATGVAATTSGLNNDAKQIRLFNSTLAAAINAGAGAGYVLSGAGSSATVPFANGDAQTIEINGAAIAIGNVGTAETVTQFIQRINGTTAARNAGIKAILDTSTAGQINVTLIVDARSDLEVSSINLTEGAGANSTNINVPTLVTNNNIQTADVAVALGSAVDTTTRQQTFGLSGGLDSGLGYGSVSVSGTVGDNILTALSQTRARVLVSFPDIDSSALTAVGNFNSDGSVFITVGGKQFAFTTTAANAKAPDEITIGSTLRETLDNAVATINSYAKNFATGDVAYDLNQINVTRSGNSLVFEGKALTNPRKLNGSTLDAISVSAGFTNGAVSSNSGLLNNAAANFGVDTTGVSNKDFTGTLSGFSATSTGVANTINLTIKVGAYTYTASNVPTASTSNTTVRLSSDVLSDGSSGGFFDIQLDSSQAQSVNSDTDAKAIAQRLDSAFSSLRFSQKRAIASYSGTQTIVSNGERIGSLIGSTISAQLSSFSGNKLTGITVIAPPTASGDAVISLNIDGETFTTGSGLGNKLGANQTYRLTSTTNVNNFIDFTTGSSIDISTSANAAAVQKALGEAFGTARGDGALTFQVGATSNDIIAVSIGSAKTTQIFDGRTLSVATQSGAAEASLVLDSAIQTVTALRAGVGALGARFNFASAALQSSVQNQDAARALLLDTDIALESTAYATSQVKLQAGISVLAQANQQLQALLKLIG